MPFLLFAAFVWIAPGIVTLATRYWTTPQGAQGPIVLATGIWAVLFEYRKNHALAERGPAMIAASWLAMALPSYILGRMAGIMSLECFAAYVGLIAIFYAYTGGRLVRRLWLPLVYLLCVIPLPYFVEAGLTGTLKVRIANWAVELLSTLGFDVANSGSSLFIDQYELLVEAACSGLNSIFSLIAIGVFYIYWQRRSEWGKAIILTALIIPIAVLANFARVVLLLLLVHLGGDRCWRPGFIGGGTGDVRHCLGAARRCRPIVISVRGAKYGAGRMIENPTGGKSCSVASCSVAPQWRRLRAARRRCLISGRRPLPRSSRTRSDPIAMKRRSGRFCRRVTS